MTHPEKHADGHGYLLGEFWYLNTTLRKLIVPLRTFRPGR